MAKLHADVAGVGPIDGEGITVWLRIVPAADNNSGCYLGVDPAWPKISAAERVTILEIAALTCLREAMTESTKGVEGYLEDFRSRLDGLVLSAQDVLFDRDDKQPGQ